MTGVRYCSIGATRMACSVSPEAHGPALNHPPEGADKDRWLWPPCPPVSVEVTVWLAHPGHEPRVREFFLPCDGEGSVQGRPDGAKAEPAAGVFHGREGGLPCQPAAGALVTRNGLVDERPPPPLRARSLRTFPAPRGPNRPCGGLAGRC